MNAKVLLLVLGCFCLTASSAQEWVTGKARISFSLQAPAGKLEAADSNASGKIAVKDGTIEFEVSVSGFRFISARMPGYINAATTKRFHQYYLETEQYPVATYKGNILQPAKLNYRRDGIYPVESRGVLSIHGVRKEITCSGKMTVKGSKVSLDAALVIRPEDYNIRKPASLGQLYFKEVKLLINAAMVRR